MALPSFSDRDDHVSAVLGSRSRIPDSLAEIAGLAWRQCRVVLSTRSGSFPGEISFVMPSLEHFRRWRSSVFVLAAEWRFAEHQNAPDTALH
jgi:hypothetical protein